MADDYTPDEETVREQYSSEQPPHIGTVGEKQAEFDRFIRKAERDAAREAEAERDEWRQTALDERGAALDLLEQIKVRDKRIQAVLAVLGLEVGDA